MTRTIPNIPDPRDSKRVIDRRGVVYEWDDGDGSLRRLGALIDGRILPLARLTKKERRRVRKARKDLDT